MTAPSISLAPALPLFLLLPAAFFAAGCEGPRRHGPAPERRPSPAAPEGGPYLAAARSVARWLESQAMPMEAGAAWPAHADEPETVAVDLYSGTAGVVLFFVDAHRVTGEARLLERARAGADHLLDALPREAEAGRFGLYTGISGVGFALLETWKATRDERYLRGARECLRLLREGAREAGAGVEWNDTSDIISGSAGIGLFLLRAARDLRGDESLDEPSPLRLAQRAGRRLIELGRPAGSGLKWAMSPTYDRLMPNFSHGTAGICYFLASLHRETGDAALLDAALAGARYLLSIARTDDDSCLIFHHEPGGEGLYYLGWCHGPAGTARLFYRLWEVTGDEKWLAQTRRCARAILVSGIPEARTPGFWNNVGLCCGSAGVAELFLGLHAASGESEHLRFARRVAGDLLTRGTRDDKGIRWLQAEHRVRPELVKVQTGAMQGAAGIGMLLLELHNLEAGRPAPMRFPDSPFPVELRRRD